MNDKTREIVQREIMKHLLAIRDIGRDYDILEGDTGISLCVFNDYVSFFSLRDEEKILNAHQFIATEVQ